MIRQQISGKLQGYRAGNEGATTGSPNTGNRPNENEMNRLRQLQDMGDMGSKTRIQLVRETAGNAAVQIDGPALRRTKEGQNSTKGLLAWKGGQVLF